MKTTTISGLTVLLFSLSVAAQNGNNQGAGNGQPFQQLQEAIDAAEAASAAATAANEAAIQVNADAISANESAIQANSSAISAEEAARMAADAAVAAEAAAALAQEAADRLAADATLQDGVDDNAYAISANTSAISANQAAIDAEEAARIAADAALDAAHSAAIAAEAAARIAADDQLQANIDAETVARIHEDTLLTKRLDILEGYHTPQSLIYTETEAQEIYIDAVQADLASLGYQSGDWFFMGAKRASGNAVMGICSNHPLIYDWVQAYANDLDWQNHFTLDIGGFVLAPTAVSWAPGLTLNLHATPTREFSEFFIHSDATHIGLIRNHNLASQSYEIYAAGYGLGNEITINSDVSRLEACGF